MQAPVAPVEACGQVLALQLTQEQGAILSARLTIGKGGGLYQGFPRGSSLNLRPAPTRLSSPLPDFA